jgi:hypothetical protein
MRSIKYNIIVYDIHTVKHVHVVTSIKYSIIVYDIHTVKHVHVVISIKYSIIVYDIHTVKHVHVMFHCMYIVYYNVILTHINKIFILLQRDPTNASLYNDIYHATIRAI